MDIENNEILTWRSEIQIDGHFLLPDGVYPFEVKDLIRGTHNGSEKLPPCPKATIKLEVEYNDTKVTLTDDLFLIKRMEWKLSSFFRAIGQKKQGERIHMDWDKVIGSTGRASITTHRFINADGREIEVNKVSKYLDK